MERVWYIIVDQKGKETVTESGKEAETAFRCGGIVREQDMHLEGVLVRTSLFIDTDDNTHFSYTL